MRTIHFDCRVGRCGNKHAICSGKMLGGACAGARLPSQATVLVRNIVGDRRDAEGARDVGRRHVVHRRRVRGVAARRVDRALPSGAGGCLRSRRAASSTTRGAAGRRSASARRRRLARARTPSDACSLNGAGSAMPPPAAGRGASPATIHTSSTPSAQMSAAAKARSVAPPARELGRVQRAADPQPILADDDTGDSVLRARGPSARRATATPPPSARVLAADASSS